MRYLITEINQLRLFFTTSARSKINSSDLQVDGDFDDVDAHVDDVPAWGAIVPGARVALERVGEIAAVQEVITEVVVASSDAFLFIKIFRLGNRIKDDLDAQMHAMIQKTEANIQQLDNLSAENAPQFMSLFEIRRWNFQLLWIHSNQQYQLDANNL